ncbi:UPF0182 family protein [Chitinispirillales bacterium ANBcel5]|nr:UPF0182 family protein [Chitinispirillales bacterium ANBcel5]
MLFNVLSVLLLVIASIPLIKASLKKNISTDEQKMLLQRGSLYLLAGIVVVASLYFLLDFVTEYFWFSQLGYSERFLTVIWTRLLLYFAGALFAGAFLYSNYAIVCSRFGLRRFGYGFYIIGFVALLLGFWPASLWNEFLLFINQVTSPVEDPIFGRSVSFYIFSLPIYSFLVGWFTVILLGGDCCSHNLKCRTVFSTKKFLSEYKS